MPAAPSHRSVRRCPQCGSSVQRVLRTANDKRRWDADDWRRYRCRSDRCDWQGLLAAPRHRRRPSPVTQGGVAALARMGRVTMMLLMAAGLAWGCYFALQLMLGT